MAETTMSPPILILSTLLLLPSLEIVSSRALDISLDALLEVKGRQASGGTETPRITWKDNFSQP